MKPAAIALFALAGLVLLAGVAAATEVQVGVSNFPPQIDGVAFEFEDILNHSIIDSIQVTARFTARDINGVRELNRTTSYCLWENTTQDFFSASEVAVTTCSLVECNASCTAFLSPFDENGTYWVTVTMEDTRHGVGTRRTPFAFESPCGKMDCPPPKPRKAVKLPWETDEPIVWSGTPKPEPTATTAAKPEIARPDDERNAFERLWRNFLRTLGLE